MLWVCWVRPRDLRELGRGSVGRRSSRAPQCSNLEGFARTRDPTMEDIEISWLLCWQWKYATQNIIYLCFQTWALAPLQIHASLCEGPIYLLLCWVIILLLKSTSWRAPMSFACISINLHWVWMWMDLFYHELQCLVSPWSSGVLCIYVLRSQKGLARYHFVISCYDYFEKVLSSEFYYYGSLADYAIDMSNCET